MEIAGHKMMRESSSNSAVERIWRHYGDQVLRFFLRKGFPFEESLDLRQDTFVRIQRYYSQDIDNEAAWILSVARSIWKNELRYRQAGKRDAAEVPLETGEGNAPLDLPEAASIGDSEVSDPLKRMLNEEEVALLWQAIDELSPRTRACVVLRLREELDYRAIGAILQVSEETVKAHMFQARKRLRAELGKSFEALHPYMEARDDRGE